MSARWAAALAGLLLTSCIGVDHLIAPLFQTPRAVPNKITRPLRSDAGLAVLWVGHATILIQLDDKVILTDPVFTPTVGQFSKRLVEPGIDAKSLPHLDAVLISHLHFDHLSLGSLDEIQDRVGALLMPEGGLVYLTDFAFPAQELQRWQRWEKDGLRITAVPVVHNGMRYGLDYAWLDRSYTGYVIQYRGKTVYFGGDSARGDHFAETGRRFPGIDVALLPISPIEPRGFMQRSHVSPEEAVQAYLALGARWMVPMHYDTFINGRDNPGDAGRALAVAMKHHHLDEQRVAVLDIGEQRVFVPRGANSLPKPASGTKTRSP